MTTTHTPLTQSPDAATEVALETSSKIVSSQARPSRTWLAASIAAATATLQACGGGGDEESPATSSLMGDEGEAPEVSAQAAQTPTSSGSAAIKASSVGGGASGPLARGRPYVVPNNDNEAARFLLQAQFSASEEDIASVKRLGYAGWLATQFQVPVGPKAWDWTVERGYGVLNSHNFHFTSYQTDFAVWHQLFKAPDQLRKRVALALSEIFSVSTNGVDYFWLSQLMTSWWDMLCAGALGNFRDLLENVTLHPAMGLYLSMRGSQKEDGKGRQPDENYAREIMQLMSIGLVKLKSDGSVVSSGGVPVETYTQDDVIGLARVFSGYDFDYSGGPSTYFNGLQVPNMEYTRRPMVLNPNLHSTLEAKFLGVKIPAGTDGNTARKIALDTLFNHPNVGAFIGKQLIQRLTTSNPSAVYVQRVTSAFNNNGKGVRGDLAAVIAAVLLDSEVRNPALVNSKTFGRLREPMVRIVQWGRTCGLESARGSWKFYNQSGTTQLGQSPLRSPTIFNFFRPGYVPPASGVSAANMVAPEFQMMNESTVSNWINHLQSLVFMGQYVGAPDLPQITSNASNGFDLRASYAREVPIAHDTVALVNRLNLLLAAGQLSTETVRIIVSALNAAPVNLNSSLDAKRNRVACALLMVMSSYDYLVQK